MSKVRDAYVPRPDGVFVDGQLVTPPSKTPANGPGTDDSDRNVAEPIRRELLNPGTRYVPVHTGED